MKTLSLQIVSVLAGVLALLSFGVHPTWAIHWDHAAQLNDDFRLLWNIKGADITFEMQVRTHGYVGLGFARSADSRAGADIVVGWVDRGQTYFQDRHMKANGALEPAIDVSQDYTLLLGYENATHTVMRFVRRLDTCDEPYDVPISNDTMRLLIVYHADEPHAAAVDSHLPGSRLSDAQLAIRAVVPLQLTGRTQGSSGSGVERTAPRQSVYTVDLRMDAVPLPQLGDALEWCRVFELGQFERKHHMVQYEPVFGSVQARRQLDALVLYECQGAAARLQAAVRLGGRVCADVRQTRGVVCEAVVASWTRGSAGLNFPPEAGYPFESHKERFYLMESHYSSNSAAETAAAAAAAAAAVAAVADSSGAAADASTVGEVPMDLSAAFAAEPMLDNSGLRLHVTSVLRPHDAGVLSIGISPDWRHIIPPGQRRVVSEGHCVDECTKRTLPADGIHIFAVVMRTHSIGKEVRLRQVRQHEELLPIASDAGVHAAYAEYRQIAPAARVLPGDSLIVECTYDSADRDAITLGGMSARGESCQVLAAYWPRQKRMTRCHSLPSLPTVLHSLGIDELAPGSQPVLIAAPVPLAGMTLESRLLGYDWADGFEAFQRVTRGGSFVAMCTNARHKNVPGTDTETFHRPRITQAWSLPPRDVCKAGVRPFAEVHGNGLDEYVTSQEPSSGSRQDVGAADVESLGLSGSERSGGKAEGLWMTWMWLVMLLLAPMVT